MEATRKHLVALVLSVALLSIVYYTFLSSQPLIERLSKSMPGQFMVSTSDFPASGKPTGPFEVTLTLLETPALNKTVTAVISVRNRKRDSVPNTFLDLILFKRTSPYVTTEGFTEWSKTERFGDMPPYSIRTVTMEVRINETGLYTLGALARSIGEGSIMGNDVQLFLNVTESATAVSKSAMIEPEPRPPAIPYLVKMDMDGVPALNRPVNLRVTIASLMDQKNATFRIFLPEGFELVSGDLVWQGDLQKAMDATEISASRENIVRGRVAEATLQRIPEDKKVRMRATVRPTLRGDAWIYVFPSQERPSTISCTLQGLNIPHPLIGKDVDAGWQAISYGGCLNVRVFNETDGAFSEQELPWVSKRLFTPPPGG